MTGEYMKSYRLTRNKINLAKPNNDNSSINRLIEERNWYKTRLEEVSKVLSLYQERELEAFAIGDVLSDGIYIVDKDETVIAVNKAFTKIMGIIEEDIIGCNVNLLVEKKFTTEPVCSMVLKQKKKVSIQNTINNRKLVVTGNPIFNKQGEVTQVLTVIRDVTELIKLQEQLERSEKLTKKYMDELNYLRQKEAGASGLIGKSPGISQVRDVISQIAPLDVTVLITGETGVGKEVVAREIYRNSPRKNAPYIKVNCAAIPESLLESELFGYEKGAFTGAQNKEKLGLFEVANTGTILLDEIGEMPIALQPKLLRVLQEKEITRIGGTQPIKLDVRVIAATNQKLHEQVANGKFRQDLFYRLSVIPIKIPSLRARLEDVSLLARHFLQKYNDKYGTNKNIDLSAIEVLQQYDWPGNIRELENVIEQVVILINEPVIRSAHILKIIDSKKLSSVFSDHTNLTLKEAVERVERQIIEDALRTHGSTHKAARVLGVSQPTVLRKARELGIMSKGE